MRSRRIRASGLYRSGAILFEFAISIPLLMLMSIAVFDFAKITYFRLVVADAAGAASRYAAFNPVTSVSLNVWQQMLDEAARSACEGSPWVSPSLLVVHPATIEQISPLEKRITVRLEYPYQIFFWWPGLPTQATVSSEVAVVGAS